MKNSRKRRWLLFALLLVLLGLFAILLLKPYEPRYQGKTVSYWFNRYCVADTGAEIEATHAALKQLGTNALSYLVKQALTTRQDSELRRKYYKILGVFPESWRFPHYVSFDQIRFAGVMAIQIVRPTARQVLPLLADALKSRDNYQHRTALEILSNIDEFDPSLAKIFAEGLHNEDEDSQKLALDSLCRFGSNALPCINDLIWFWDSKAINKKSKTMIAECLATMRSGAVEALPILRREFETETNWLHKCIYASALGQIGTEEPQALDFLIKSLRDPVDNGNLTLGAELTMNEVGKGEYPFLNHARFAAEGLGKIGSQARIAMPMLIEVLNGSNFVAWPTAAVALKSLRAPKESYLPKLRENLKSGSADVRLIVSIAILDLEPNDTEAQSVKQAVIIERSK